MHVRITHSKPRHRAYFSRYWPRLRGAGVYKATEQSKCLRVLLGKACCGAKWQRPERWCGCHVPAELQVVQVFAARRKRRRPTDPKEHLLVLEVLTKGLADAWDVFLFSLEQVGLQATVLGQWRDPYTTTVLVEQCPSTYKGRHFTKGMRKP